ncbi:MAG: aspartyl protease family protein [Labilithrix sp.]|nr:aspartyl protease family protein [Labilithrix sp.]MCW5809900.1 aspartyl protease family protein [Labilithrix sp.]
MLLGGCAETASSSKPRLAAATPGKLTKRALIRYDIRGRPFPLPVVTGHVAGQPVLMLVDTGANSHVIAGWLARKLGLPMKKLGDIGTDHVGKSIAAYRLDGVDIAIDDWGKLATTTLLATEVPPVIEKLGIGAFISPQRLEEEGDAVVLDLAKGELRSAWWDESLREMADKGVRLFDVDQGRTCEDSEGPVRGLAYVMPSVIEQQKVSLLVDTGAQHSDVFIGSSAGQRLLPQSTPNKEAMYTASGPITARKIANARITTGSFSVTANVDLIQGAADASCPRDGVLAMDVLRSCSLLLGRTRIVGRCAPSK